MGRKYPKGADLEKQNCLFGVHPVELGKWTFVLSTRFPELIFNARSFSTKSAIAPYRSERLRDALGYPNDRLVEQKEAVREAEASDDEVVNLLQMAELHHRDNQRKVAQHP